MRTPYKYRKDTYVLPSDLPIPGAGLQPVNAFLLRERHPILFDTGMPVDREDFLKALWSLVDPADLRFVVVTHDDRDHTGTLAQILEQAPNAKLITNGVSLIRLSEEFHLPQDRVLTVNPGQSFSLGEHRFEVLRPPTFDSPGTIGLFDHAEEVLYSSDSFGTILPQPVELADVDDPAFREGFDIFNRAIAPWSAVTDLPRFHANLRRLARLNPRTILSSHAPVIHHGVDTVIDAMSDIPLLPAWFPAATLDTEAALELHEATLAKEASP
ncbi:hypothetical protein Afil01_07480 [Actinorhabdospora filicis]|uniref:Metallo-beta-lactamase domain-containing protein n=1 Tax=Actinorhabdospora filicis TaxID=1785913 RepID=A0A9W6SJU0_9ACTN|nr:MBL fold metallo-hydrolase [Actinorhabdospora filicis]GLZ75941.1 hypothetical protein Afil01_07480 [Actinorhabdospora filicis]